MALYSQCSIMNKHLINSYLRVAGIIPGLDHQFMDPLQFKIQWSIQSDDPRLDINDEVTVRVTLTPVDFIKNQTIITLILICCKHL